MSNTGAGPSGSTFIGLFTATALPVAVGAAIAAGSMFALVYSQTQGPDTNPASQEILVYGD